MENTLQETISKKKQSGIRKLETIIPLLGWPGFIGVIFSVMAVVSFVLFFFVAVKNSSGIQTSQPNAPNSPPESTPIAPPFRFVEGGFAQGVIDGIIGNANQLFPDENLIPSIMYLAIDKKLSNQEIANNHGEQASSYLEKYESWERKTNYYREYRNKNNCVAQDGLDRIYFQVSFFQTSSGANQYFSEIIMGNQVKNLGENAYIHTYDVGTENGCPLDAVTIWFKRYSAIGRIRINSIEGVVDLAYLKQIALSYAQNMDQNLISLSTK